MTRILCELVIICAWCGKHLGTKPGGDGVTHGICADCAKTLKGGGK